MRSKVILERNSNQTTTTELSMRRWKTTSSKLTSQMRLNIIKRKDFEERGLEFGTIDARAASL
jgi:hypothetical protein